MALNFLNNTFISDETLAPELRKIVKASYEDMKSKRAVPEPRRQSNRASSDLRCSGCKNIFLRSEMAQLEWYSSKTERRHFCPACIYKKRVKHYGRDRFNENITAKNESQI